MSTENTLVRPAPDCPAAGAEIPPSRAQKTRAEIEFDLLTSAPYTLTHLDFSHRVHVIAAEGKGQEPLSFDAFHAKGQPCMRASALTKRYGWAAHYDTAGKLALIDPASAAFSALAKDSGVVKTDAMRTSRR